MKDKKIRDFMMLAGQKIHESYKTASLEERKLGARLLLSEVLEYVIAGLGVIPEVNGQKIEDPESLKYLDSGREPQEIDMLDGLADVAYTMYWNSCAFNMRLEEAFELVCDNNLEKFVKLGAWAKNFVPNGKLGVLPKDKWHCEREVTWPESVMKVEIINLGGEYYGVGKDASGKVRKPSIYASVDLKPLLSEA